MTREDVKKIFPDATDEQITSLLNQSNSDVAKEKAKNQKLKEDAEKAKALETELEELKKQNMSEAERTELEHQKEKATNEKRISDLESALKAAQKDALTGKITSIFASAGMKGDAYSGAIWMPKMHSKKPRLLLMEFPKKKNQRLIPQKPHGKKKPLKRHLIRVAVNLVENQKRKAKHLNMQKRTQQKCVQKINRQMIMPQ